MSARLAGILNMKGGMKVRIYHGEKVVDVRNSNGIKFCYKIHQNDTDGKVLREPFAADVFSAPAEGEPVPTYSIVYDPRSDPDYILPSSFRQYLPSDHSGHIVSDRTLKKLRHADNMKMRRECGMMEKGKGVNGSQSIKTKPSKDSKE